MEQPEDEIFYAKTRLPTEFGDFDVRVLNFEGKEHLAISCGDLRNAQDLLVRVHSECLTGEVLGSLKCDCKPQLDLALSRISEAGRGLVIYLRQEGRGIGLGNKIRAYALQETGADTVDANRLLGLEDDSRTYEAASRMLSALGVTSVRLMTNNPAKINGLRNLGITVSGRLETVAGVNAVNSGYLETKTKRMGHMLNDDDVTVRPAPRRVV